MRRIALVACAKSKRAGIVAAKDLYVSTLFQLSRQYAERHSDSWYVLSAKYGLVHPDQEIQTYDLTLKGAGVQAQRDWAKRTLAQFKAAGLLSGEIELLWLAGQDYQRELRALLGGVPQVDPLKGMTQGVRMSWLKRHLAG